MAETVGVVKKRELQFSKNSSSNKRCSSTILCKQYGFVGQSGERERVYSRELSFIYHAQNTVLVGIEIIDFNRIRMEKRMDYVAT